MGHKCIDAFTKDFDVSLGVSGDVEDKTWIIGGELECVSYGAAGGGGGARHGHRRVQLRSSLVRGSRLVAEFVRAV